VAVEAVVVLGVQVLKQELLQPQMVPVEVVLVV
jgi:hypothetical protein